MANTKSAKKANRSSLRKRAYNLVTKNKVKSALKTFRKSVTQGSGISSADIISSLASTYSALDKAVKSNFIPKRRADRKKSRLAKFVAKQAQTNLS